jgi:cytoskeletal protein RodZ
LGVTLREAAEFTKIRTDYLQAMEANQFESIPLAEVYKRGFVKVYARYLRLDDEKAGSDFNTHHSVRAARRPLDAAGQEEEEVPFEPVAGGSLTVNRDNILWIVLGVAFTALLVWVFFS